MLGASLGRVETRLCVGSRAGRNECDGMIEGVYTLVLVLARFMMSVGRNNTGLGSEE